MLTKILEDYQGTGGSPELESAGGAKGATGAVQGGSLSARASSFTAGCFVVVPGSAPMVCGAAELALAGRGGGGGGATREGPCPFPCPFPLGPGWGPGTMAEAAEADEAWASAEKVSALTWLGALPAVASAKGEAVSPPTWLGPWLAAPTGSGAETAAGAKTGAGGGSDLAALAFALPTEPGSFGADPAFATEPLAFAGPAFGRAFGSGALTPAGAGVIGVFGSGGGVIGVFGSGGVLEAEAAPEFWSSARHSPQSCSCSSDASHHLPEFLDCHQVWPVPCHAWSVHCWSVHC